MHLCKYGSNGEFRSNEDQISAEETSSRSRYAVARGRRRLDTKRLSRSPPRGAKTPRRAETGRILEWIFEPWRATRGISAFTTVKVYFTSLMYYSGPRRGVAPLYHISSRCAASAPRRAAPRVSFLANRVLPPDPR